MTTCHAPNDTGDWRVVRTADVKVRHSHAGRLVLPLSLFQGGGHLADVPLVMTATEAEALYGELDCLLYSGAQGETS